MPEEQLKFPALVQPYISQNTIDSASENVEQTRTLLEKWLNPFESHLMTAQSLLIWEKPLKSFGSIILILFAFWFYSSKYVLGTLCFTLLMLYWIYLWKCLIWPTIRVPPNKNELEEWVPVHANLLSITDMSQYLAEAFVILQASYEALCNLRQRRKSAFLVLMVSVSALMLVIGHYISGFTLVTIFVTSVLLTPCAIYHQVLPTLYMKIEPYLMALQYKLITRTGIAREQGGASTRTGGTFDTESEEEIIPASDPVLNAAIARTITDTEDESVGSSSGPSHDHNSDIDSIGVEARVADELELEPDVSLMPDFENVCEDSQATFMIEADVMPSMDDVDHSRLTSDAMPEHIDNTDSDTESLPFDDFMPSAQAQRSAPRHTTTTSVIPSAPPSQSETSTTRSSYSNKMNSSEPSAEEVSPLSMLTGAATRLASGMFSSLQAPGDLRLDPRDRIADASADGDAEGPLGSDELGFEIISKDELDQIE